MNFKYPLNFSIAKEAYNNNEKGEGGYFPVGLNNFWHDGIHLHGEHAVTAIADGQIIACRICNDYITDQIDREEVTYSNGFVLMKHKYKTPQNQYIEFYSLYMHLLPKKIIKLQNKKEPIFYKQRKYTINTTEDGAGISLYSVNNKNVRVAVIPAESLICSGWIPPSINSSHWSNRPENKGKYTYVEYLGIGGFVRNLSNYVHSTEVGGFGVVEVHKIVWNKKAKDSPLRGKAGLNVRSDKLTTADLTRQDRPFVLYVLTYGEEVHFEDEYTFLKKPIGPHKLSIKNHPEGGWIYVYRHGLIEKTTNEIPIDTIYTFQNTINVKAGDVIGYTGKYNNDYMVHIETFMENIDFMNYNSRLQPKHEVYIIKKGANFFKKKSEPEKIEVNIPKGSCLKLLTPLSKLKGKYPYKHARSVQLMEPLWVKRSELGKDLQDRFGRWYYTMKSVLFKAYKKLPNEDPVNIETSKKQKYRYKNHSGDYRQVYFPIQGKKIWINVNDISVYRNHGYDYTCGLYQLLKNLKYCYKDNPEIINFCQDLDYTVQEDIEIQSVNVKKIQGKDSDGRLSTWLGFTLKEGVVGWVKENNNRIEKIDYYDWKKFFNIVDEDRSIDSICDARSIIRLIEGDGSRAGYSSNNFIEKPELLNAVRNEDYGLRLRKMVCKHPIEWSSKSIEDIKRRLKEAPWNFTESKIDQMILHMKKLNWWESVTKHLPQDPKRLWFIHPVAFIEHLRKIQNSFNTTFILNMLTKLKNYLITSCGLDCNQYFKKLSNEIKYAASPVEVVNKLREMSKKYTIQLKNNAKQEYINNSICKALMRIYKGEDDDYKTGLHYGLTMFFNNDKFKALIETAKGFTNSFLKAYYSEKGTKNRKPGCVVRWVYGKDDLDNLGSPVSMRFSPEKNFYGFHVDCVGFVISMHKICNMHPVKTPLNEWQKKSKAVKKRKYKTVDGVGNIYYSGYVKQLVNIEQGAMLFCDGHIMLGEEGDGKLINIVHSSGVYGPIITLQSDSYYSTLASKMTNWKNKYKHSQYARIMLK